MPPFDPFVFASPHAGKGDVHITTPPYLSTLCGIAADTLNRHTVLSPLFPLCPICYGKAKRLGLDIEPRRVLHSREVFDLG